MKKTEHFRGNEEDCIGIGFSSTNASFTAVNSTTSVEAKTNTIEFYFQQAFSQNQPQFQQKQLEAQQQYNFNKEYQQQESKKQKLNEKQHENNFQIENNHIVQGIKTNTNVTQAIQTAKALAMKFHMQSTGSNPPLQISIDYEDQTVHQRPHLKQQLVQFEESFQRRLQKAFLKNLEYISRKDEEALQLQLKNLEQSKQYDRLLERNSNMAYKERQKVMYGNKKENNTTMLTTKAGLGTGIRNHQSKKERRQVYGHIEEQRKQHSLYVMGIKTQSDTKQSTSEANIQYRNEHDIHKDLFHIFQSYGSIHKLKLYKNHKSGKLKGDALIMYQDNVDLASICVQLNGAELPCGSVLRVQPAKFENKSVSLQSYTSNSMLSAQNHFLEENDDEIRYEKKPASQITDSPAIKKGDLNETDDLDDFFDSLG